MKYLAGLVRNSTFQFVLFIGYRKFHVVQKKAEQYEYHEDTVSLTQWSQGGLIHVLDQLKFIISYYKKTGKMPKHFPDNIGQKHQLCRLAHQGIVTGCSYC